MFNRHVRTAATVILLAGAAGFALSGCETIERETGMSKSTQTGAVGGATFGGIVAWLAGANPAWIAASTVLGGVTGGVIGNELGKEDAQKHAENNLNALDNLGQGQTSSWQDASTGNSGSTTVTAVKTKADGTVCKDFTETVKTSAKTVTQQATACKTSSGWKVQG